MIREVVISGKTVSLGRPVIIRGRVFRLHETAEAIKLHIHRPRELSDLSQIKMVPVIRIGRRLRSPHRDRRLFRRFRNDIDDAAHGLRPVQGAGRAVYNLHPLHVMNIDALQSVGIAQRCAALVGQTAAVH